MADQQQQDGAQVPLPPLLPEGMAEFFYAAAAAAQAKATANAVETVNLPAFWAGQPSTWFDSIEAAFELRRITVSRTKYVHVVNKLPCDVLVTVAHITANYEDRADPYQDIKDALCRTYS